MSNNQLLRFTTAGSVDDGKSTLIGRLLYDSKSIYEDQLDAVTKSSLRKGQDAIDLALFTDGLRDERAQGITIDVAHRYFTTPKRKFIITDTPGHFEYTRNMVTGASMANVALILVDATQGVSEQTKRHSYLASLLGIPHILLCINKMDLVDFSEEVYESIVEQYEAISSKMLIRDVRYIPISALNGDNVVHRSTNMNWFLGSPLLHTLETIHVSSDLNKVDARFPVQDVLKVKDVHSTGKNYHLGRLSSGILRPGDDIVVLPSGEFSTIKSISGPSGPLEEAFAGMSVSICLSNEPAIERGNMICRVNNRSQPTREFDAMLCWLDDHDATTADYKILHTTNWTDAKIKEVIYKFDMEQMSRDSSSKELSMNDIAKVKIHTAEPLMTDPYRENRVSGSFILVDNITNATVAAGMIL